MTFGEKITALRKKRKCSQSHLARELSISRDAVSKYERDEMTPSVDNAKRIADFYEVSLDYLVSPEIEAPVADAKMLSRIRELERLDEADRSTVIRVIDAFVRDAGARRAYAT